MTHLCRDNGLKPNQMKKHKRKKREHLDHFFIAGFTYYDGPEAFKKLEVGELLDLELEEDNAYDARAVMILFKDYHLGYVPRDSNRIFYKLLRMGVTNIECRIQSIDPTEYPEHQVSVVAHLVNKGKWFKKLLVF